MQGASQACIDTNQEFIDETLDMVIDDSFRYMLNYPQANYQAARDAGYHRVYMPTTYGSLYPNTV